MCQSRFIVAFPCVVRNKEKSADFCRVIVNLRIAKYGGRHLFESVATIDNLICSGISSIEINIILALRIGSPVPVARVINAIQIELFSVISSIPIIGDDIIIVFHHIPIRVNRGAQSPPGDAIISSQSQRLIRAAPRIGSIVGDYSVAVKDFPPVGCWIVSVSDNTVVGFARARIKLDIAILSGSLPCKIGSVRHLAHCTASRHRHQLLSTVNIYFTFPIPFVPRHSPASLHRNGRHGKVPAHAEPSVSTAAVVGKGKIGLHSLPAGRNFQLVAHVGRTVVVGRRRLYVLKPLHGIGRLEFLETGRGKGRCFRHFGCLDDGIHKIREVIHLGIYQSVCYTYGILLNGKPTSIAYIVVVGNNVFRRIPDRNQRGVVREHDGDVLVENHSVGQHPVTHRVAGYVHHSLVKRGKGVVR